jgi:hypothetical protein
VKTGQERIHLMLPPKPIILWESHNPVKNSKPNSTPPSPHIAKQKVFYTIQKLWFICHFLFKALLLMACTSVVVA